MKNLNLAFLEEVAPVLERLEQKKAQIDRHRPLPGMVLDRLRQDMALEWTYNSNGIEGNSMTLVETRVVLEEGITIGGKSLREHFEVVNHHKAIHYLEELVSPGYELRCIDILRLHELVMTNIQDDYAGRVRTGAVRIVGANFTPPAATKVSDLLDELVDLTGQNTYGLHTLVLAAVFHHQLVWIHPFFDGNGRTARLAMNALLLREGYPPAVILRNDRKKYYSALNQANKGDYAKFALMFLQAVERSLNIYVNALPGGYGQGDYEPISDIVSEPLIPYGAEYVSLLARTGKISAHKEGRNWVTTRQAVLDYYAATNDK